MSAFERKADPIPGVESRCVLNNLNRLFQDRDYSIFLLNGGLVLKDYSKTFCKIVVADNSTGRLIPEPDQICYEEVELLSEKRWYDFLIK